MDVTVATALMPPLCALGIGLALRRPDVSGGAFLLFVVNLAAIVLASSLVFVAMGFRPLDVHRTRMPIRTVFALEASVLVVVFIPLLQLTLGVLHQAQQYSIIRTTLFPVCGCRQREKPRTSRSCSSSARIVKRSAYRTSHPISPSACGRK